MWRVRGLSRISLSYNVLPLFSADASIYVSFSPSYFNTAPRKRPESPTPSPAAYGRRPSAADTAGHVRRTVSGAGRIAGPAGRNGPPDSGAANTIFRSILSCLSLNFAKNRFSRKIGFRQKTSAFFRKTREISVFIAKKQRCFSENVLFFSLFPKKYRFPSINLTEKNYLCSRRTKYIVQGQ